MDYRVIKENDLFLLTDLSGDIADNPYGHGLYTKDMRFLNRMALTINGAKPVLLSSEADQNYISQILLTNPEIRRGDEVILWRESVEIERTRFIYRDVLYETIKATNFNPSRQTLDISLVLDADFHDMFIVRGFQNGNVGRKKEVKRLRSGFEIDYDGKDAVLRKLLVEWTEKPASVQVSAQGVEIGYTLDLEAGQSQAIDLFIVPVTDENKPRRYPHAFAIQKLRESYEQWENESTSADSDHPLFNSLYQRGLLDIRVLLTDLGYGRFPVAGLPWYAVPFGRDSLITALQMLPVHPEIAKGTILTMARHQGEKVDLWRDEQPGKIMHELRKGELANTNQIPFTPYYGSVDSTPLFLILIGEYVRWTDDTALLKAVLPHIKRALEWIDKYGDPGGSGFTSYRSESAKGIANQGWKDSANSIVHRSGEYAETPIALVEVQGYVYQAKKGLSELLPALKSTDEDVIDWAERLEAEAEALRERFESAFWLAADRYYALALDREGQQVETAASNAGHALMSGMMAHDRAAAVASKLISPELFSGYGIRTMALGEKGYSPMSYHNGSVWPHDNAVCLMGLTAQGFHREALVVMEGLLQAGRHFENNRLPELFCGYGSQLGKPVRYPVACSPQAWAAATPLVFVPSMLGFRMDYKLRRIMLEPNLPSGMNRLEVRRMRIGSGYLDVNVTRNEAGGSFAHEVVNNTTGWNVGEQAVQGW